MNRKHLTRLAALSLALCTAAPALASGAPTSQFYFKGWPYRAETSCQSKGCRYPGRCVNGNACQGNGCETACPNVTPCPSIAPIPTQAPTPDSTAIPTAEPSMPSTEPTAVPTLEPTPIPTVKPTQLPTQAPTAKPTQLPTQAPTARPTQLPTQAPTVKPTQQPTAKPTQVPVPPSTDDDYTTDSLTAQEKTAWNLLNEDRTRNGLSALPLDQELSRLARLKSEDMRDNNYFAHTSPTYGSASAMLRSFGYAFTGVGENIAHHATVEKSQAAFMSSTGHRQNILGSQWARVGLGVCYDANGFVYVTQLFVR